MEPETHEQSDREPLAANQAPSDAPSPEQAQPELPQFEPLQPEPAEKNRGITWGFIGPQGLRAGWSVLIFIASMILLMVMMGFILHATHVVHRGEKMEFTAPKMILSEAVSLLALLGAAFIVALIEKRRIVDFNLRGARRPQHFFGGVAAGFVALSVLVGVLAAGGWLHIGGLALSGPAIAEYALLWGFCFFLVGCTEEGTFRCYLQFTLTRGINFWWAFGLVAAMCVDLVLRAKGNGVWGVYAMALLGLGPCLWLHLKRIPNSAFWQAAWVTSTLFGFVHTGNGGENPIGIFQAAYVGAVFCVSLRLTGSAWWAIGCHAGWDWAQTFFYGTPDSGMVGTGHLLKSTMAGNILWSGGPDGPEGSILGVGIVTLLLLWILLVYGRTNPSQTAPAVELTAE